MTTNGLRLLAEAINVDSEADKSSVTAPSDMIEWRSGGPTGGPEPRSPVRSIGAESSATVVPAGDLKDRRSTTQQFLDWAIQNCEVFPSDEGRVYGVLPHQPHRALPVGGKTGLVAELAVRYHAQTLQWPNKAARTEVEDYLTVKGAQAEWRQLFLRSAWKAATNMLWLDLGDPDWTVVELTSGGWRLTKSAPVVFRRVPTSAGLDVAAEPVDMQSGLSELWSLVPLAARDQPLVLALLINAWLTGVPQPVVLVTGPRDSGKTNAARFLVSLIDPSTHERGGSLPKDEEAWKARANTARVTLIDNVGHITTAQSDLLSRVATGGEATNRTLYTDDTAHVTSLRLPVWMTSTDAGVLRDDLASRVARLELLPLRPETRLAESELARRQETARPMITCALLELTAQVLGRLPEQSTQGLTHRMGDFEQVLRCLDQILGTRGIARLQELAEELVGDVLECDTVAQALIAGVRRTGTATYYEADQLCERRNLIGSWSPSTLLELITAHATPAARRSRSWPKTPGVLTSHLRRLAPALEEVHGIRITTGLREGKDRNRKTTIELIQNRPME